MPELAWNESTRWLVLEGLLPLFGAAVLYLLLGVMRYIATHKGTFKFSWSGWVDPLGWLYGGTILAIQAGLTSIRSGNTRIAVYCFAAGAISLLQLLVAMLIRGEGTKPEPPTKLQVVAALLVLASLTAGYNAHTGALHRDTPTANATGGIR